MQKSIKIGNAQAFWGDSPHAPAHLLKLQPNLDYLTLDYLSELSLSIMAGQREKNPESGYAADFLEVIRSLVPFWKEGNSVKIVTNAGGLNPQGCAQACVKILRENGLKMKIAIVSGDDVLPQIKSNPQDPLFNRLDSHTPVAEVLNSLVTANAYFGAKPIVDALKGGAQIVITGRVADPSLTVGPCVAHFSWKWDDYDRIAAATVAGHLIECGTQVTGGISTHWLEMPELSNIGYPFVEMNETGEFVITKPSCSGGAVTIETVKEQLLYEMGDPDQYLSPDAIVSFLSLKLEGDGPNRIRVTGAKGKAPPATYKVSAAYKAGYKSEGLLALYGMQVCEKAACCGEVILKRVEQSGYVLDKTRVESIGCGDVVPGIHHGRVCAVPMECMLRICVLDPRKEAVECFSKELAAMVTSGPQGVTGYTSGRPPVRPVFGFWPCLIECSKVVPKVEFIEVVP